MYYFQLFHNISDHPKNKEKEATVEIVEMWLEF